MLNFSLSSNSTTKSFTDFFRFDVDVVDGEEVCLHLFVTGGKNCLKCFRVCLHAVPFKSVDSNFSHVLTRCALTFSIFSSLCRLYYHLRSYKELFHLKMQRCYLGKCPSQDFEIWCP